MLQELIIRYATALKENDVKLARSIEKELARVGMDEMTLIVLVNEYLKEGTL